MSRKRKQLEKLLDGKADNNFPFDDLLAVLGHKGWTERGGGGSHRIFFNPLHPAAMVNVQPGANGKAKSYQIRQIRELFRKTENENEQGK
ncbi:MAG: type II toxin-antitoxin system HicA family toxin [Opitutaceae bacterium]|jgi:predicted RNA binding protein YcfA (HicA-like mRNA interferase family)|nr:type II toxin-antitoxin system HicA family toxin [Opitutaceae bacterium]